MREHVETPDRERFAPLVRYFGEAVAFAGHVGVKVGEIKPGRAILYVDVEKFHLNGNDTLHGGAHATLVDSAMSLSLIALTGSRIATAHMNVHYLGPLEGGRVTCRGEVVHRTRRTATAEGRVYDEEGNILAVATGPFRGFRKKAHA